MINWWFFEIYIGLFFSKMFGMMKVNDAEFW